MDDVLLLLHRWPLDGDIHDHGHEYFLALLAPSADLLHIDVLIAIRAATFRTQPSVDALRVKVMATICHEVGILVQADRTDLLGLVLVAFRIPEHVRGIFHTMRIFRRVVDFDLGVGRVPLPVSVLRMDLLRASHANKSTDDDSQRHADRTADGRQRDHENIGFLSAQETATL